MPAIMMIVSICPMVAPAIMASTMMFAAYISSRRIAIPIPMEAKLMIVNSVFPYFAREMTPTMKMRSPGSTARRSAPTLALKLRVAPKPAVQK